MQIHNKQVEGSLIDLQTRCKHYYSEKDIIAIKFPCCDTYFPCFECHQEAVDHKPQIWRKEQFHQKAILCGVCGYELSIEEYMTCDFHCPSCHSDFNPGCKFHYHLYFEWDSN